MTRISDPPPEANRVPWERSPSKRRSSLCAADGVEEKTVTRRFFSKLEQQKMNHFVIAHHCFLSQPELAEL